MYWFVNKSVPNAGMNILKSMFDSETIKVP